MIRLDTWEVIDGISLEASSGKLSPVGVPKLSDQRKLVLGQVQ